MSFFSCFSTKNSNEGPNDVPKKNISPPKNNVPLGNYANPLSFKANQNPHQIIAVEKEVEPKVPKKIINPTEFYDLIIKIKSLNELKTTGWQLEYHEKNKDQKNDDLFRENIIVGVIGYENVGKTFLLSKLSGMNLPNGYDINTKGLSFKLSEIKNEHILYIDMAGCGKCFEYCDEDYKKLVADKNIDIDKINYFKKQIMNETIMTELFLQDYTLETCNIVLIVLELLTQDYQKLILRIITKYYNKSIFIVHNFLHLTEIKDVKTQIERDIKNTFAVEERQYNIMEETKENITYYQQTFKDNNFIISHLICAQENSPAGNYYNNQTINFLRTNIWSQQKFSPYSYFDTLKIFTNKKNLSRFVKFNEENGSKVNPNFTLEKKGNTILLDKQINFTIKEGLFTIYGLVEASMDESFSPPHKCYEEKEQFVIFISIPGKIEKDEVSLSKVTNSESVGLKIEGKCGAMFEEILEKDIKICEENGEINGKFRKTIYFVALNRINEIDYDNKKIIYENGVYVIIIPKIDNGGAKKNISLID